MEELFIEDGFVYFIEENLNYKIKSFKCMEFSIKSILNINKINEGINISGFIYKEDYKEMPIEIIDVIEIFINNEKVSEVLPVDGIVEIGIDVINIEDIKLYFTEKNNKKVFGNYNIGGISNV